MVADVDERLKERLDDDVVEIVEELEATPEADRLEAEDPDLQKAILESCSIRLLTPLSRCVRLAPITTICKTAGGVFKEQEFPH